ncbi:MAG: ATP-binding cassette domain-containing protein [Bacteriovoracales bacterium]|nr:ATP-binding cassette domain-containing protein [Bacteriovoracales bacterium]
MSTPLLEVRHLTKRFPIRGGLLGREIGHIEAVGDVSFKIHKGECLGLVGESGCGKSTLGRSLLRLIEPTSGEVLFYGENILKMDRTKLRHLRKKVQIIFQDPYASLNPRMTVGDILGEPIDIHGLANSRAEKKKRVAELLDHVQLSKDSIFKYPHEFSGGQRQRICIARALAVGPEFIVCDEPVSALDVSVQAQVINLLMDLQKELDLTYLFIAHDLKVVEFISHRISVMYLGHIVESAKAHQLYRTPRHPYTKALTSAIPVPNPFHKSQRIILKGDVPSPISPPAGCHFHPRCWKASEQCSKAFPEETNGGSDHFFRCFHPNE